MGNGFLVQNQICHVEIFFPIHLGAFLVGYIINLFVSRFYIPRPTLEVKHCCSGSYKCKLILPPSSAFQTLEGPTERSCQKAKQSACLEACKKLHQMGALDDYLSPCTEVPFGEHQSEKDLMRPATANGEGMTLFTLF